jgi:hypothetical protein
MGKISMGKKMGLRADPPCTVDNGHWRVDKPLPHDCVMVNQNPLTLSATYNAGATDSLTMQITDIAGNLCGNDTFLLDPDFPGGKQVTRRLAMGTVPQFCNEGNENRTCKVLSHGSQGEFKFAIKVAGGSGVRPLRPVRRALGLGAWTILRPKPGHAPVVGDKILVSVRHAHIADDPLFVYIFLPNGTLLNEHRFEAIGGKHQTRLEVGKGARKICVFVHKNGALSFEVRMLARKPRSLGRRAKRR